ncbi:MAG: hypothetical protein P8O03_05535 [Ilumatobacter sp.]|nr:hypothetical protein [Ilumatobacter sp.]
MAGSTSPAGSGSGALTGAIAGPKSSTRSTAGSPGVAVLPTIAAVLSSFAENGSVQRRDKSLHLGDVESSRSEHLRDELGHQLTCHLTRLVATFPVGDNADVVAHIKRILVVTAHATDVRRRRQVKVGPAADSNVPA